MAGSRARNMLRSATYKSAVVLSILRRSIDFEFEGSSVTIADLCGVRVVLFRTGSTFYVPLVDELSQRAPSCLGSIRLPTDSVSPSS
jgi:hypothetical protein